MFILWDYVHPFGCSGFFYQFRIYLLSITNNNVFGSSGQPQIIGAGLPQGIEGLDQSETIKGFGKGQLVSSIKLGV